MHERACPTSLPRTLRALTRGTGALLAAFVLGALVPTAALAKIPAPAVGVPSATLITMQGVPLWSRKPTAKRRIASQIKMLTALVVRERCGLDDIATVPQAVRQVWSGAVGLVPGQKLTVRQLLNIMLIHSANDAAVTLACHVSGTESKFAVLMNAKGKAIGLKSTIAKDSNGLGKHETSTASDLTIMARKVMADPVLRAIVGRRSVQVPRPDGSSTTYGTTDQLLGVYKGMEGTKTGYTDPAGYCFTGTAKRGDVELVGVVLGASSNAARFSQMRKLLDWGFAHCHYRTLVSMNTTIGLLPVASGDASRVAVCTTQNVAAAVFDGAAKATLKLSFTTTPTAPIVAGRVVGTVSVYAGGVLIKKLRVVAKSAVATLPAPASAPAAPVAPAGIPAVPATATPASRADMPAVHDVWCRPGAALPVRTAGFALA